MMRNQYHKHTALIYMTFVVVSFLFCRVSNSQITIYDVEYTLFGSEYSPNGNQFVVGAAPEVALWDSKTVEKTRVMKRIQPYQDDNSYIFGSFAFSPDGKLLVGGMVYGLAVLWDIETGDVVRFWGVPESQQNGPAWSLSAVAFSFDGKEIGALRGGTFTLWDTNTGEMIRRGKGEYYNGQDNAYGEMFLYPDGKRVFTRLFGYSYVTDYVSGERLIDAIGSGLSMDGTRLFQSNSPDQICRIITVNSNTTSKEITNCGGHRITVAPDNQTVAYTRDDIIYIERWPLTGDRKELARIDSEKKENDHILALRFSPDGKQLMVRQNKSLRLYDVSNLTSSVNEAEMLKR